MTFYMRHSFITILLLLFLSGCSAQSGRLIEFRKVDNIEETPIYPRLSQDNEGALELREEYRYIDDIDMNWITYKSDGLKVSGLLVQPKKLGDYPCIIYNRGGNRDFGSLTVATAAIRMGVLAKEGYIVIASNYRGSGRSEGQEEFGGADVNDVLNLIEVLKEIEGANTEKIGMYGWSRGGMMTYLALTKTNHIKAAVVGGASADLTVIDRPNMETNVYAELIPNYEDNKDEELRKRSAVFWADQFPKDVPILMLHGNADWRVKAEDSLKLAMEFEKYRVPYRLKIFEGGDHGISEHRSEVDADVLNWFDRFLKHNEALPNMEYHGR